MTRHSWSVPAIALVAVMSAAQWVTPALAISNRTLIAPMGAALNDELGTSVASAGDVNGDGYADVIAGAPYNDAGGSDAGQAYVYFGGPGADDVPDLTLTGIAAGDEFGQAVGSAGDVNGDGYDDVVVGAAKNDAAGLDAGQAYVFYGGPGADALADLTLTGEASLDLFGWSAGTAGDVNGDGYADVIVGAYDNDSGGPGFGRAYVFFGGPGADAVADWTLTGTAAEFLGYSLGTAGDVNGDGYSDVIVGAHFSSAGGAGTGRAYVYYGGPAPDAVADLTMTGTTLSDYFGYSVGAAGDVNGDGYADVIASAPWSDAGGDASGEVYVFYGGPQADSVADLVVTGPSASWLIGTSVGTAGDVNGDGYADVIVGAPYSDAGGTDAGGAYVYFGGPWPDNVADLAVVGTFAYRYFGWSVGGAGDVNGDGHADVIVGVPRDNTPAGNFGRARVVAVYPYELLSPNGGEQWVAGRPATVRWRGHDAADIAISSDGGLTYATVASQVGGVEQNECTLTAPLAVTEYAKVRVTYTGQAAARSTSDASAGVFRIVAPVTPRPVASRLQCTFFGDAPYGYFGHSVGSAGDMNGDGHDDLIVGAYGDDGGGSGPGGAYVYYGGPTTDPVADLMLTGTGPFDCFGYSVGTAGDVNRDGYADVIVGAYLNDVGGTNAGAAYVYYGGPFVGGLPDVMLMGAGGGDFLGRSVGAAGDVNGDGYADVIAGAPGNDAAGLNSGRAYVYFGGPITDAVADLTLTGTAAGDYFGSSVGAAGDVNGDGYGDVIVGAFYNDAGGMDAGRAYVYYGGPGADAVADLVLTGAGAGDLFGISAQPAGDVNADGFGDVVVGAPYNDAAGAEAGRAYVFFGGPGADAVADLTLTGIQAGDFFGMSVGTAGDVNGDGFADVIVGATGNDTAGPDAGQAYVYYGGPGADSQADIVLTGQAAGDNFGISVGAAGNVFGDSRAGAIVGAYLNGAVAEMSGTAYLYDLNRYHLLSPVGGETWNVGALKQISWLGSEPADLWLSTDGGNSYELQETGVGGAESNVVEFRVPHTPTKFARVKLMPSDASLGGLDRSDSLFTIQTSVSLLALLAAPLPEGGASITWRTEPGPEDLAGYRLERAVGEGGWTALAAMTRETSVTDPAGGPGVRYRLFAVNGLGEELWLGEAALRPARPIAAWPLPYRGGDLTVSFATFGGLGGGAGAAEVSVYDVRGRLVRRVARGDFAAGCQLTRWDGRDETGRPVAAGIYLLRARSAGQERTLKITVLR